MQVNVYQLITITDADRLDQLIYIADAGQAESADTNY